jgi:hypothetical protein
MAKYILELQSRQLYPGPRETSMTELLEAKMLCEWSDDAAVEKDFDVILESDRNRFSEPVAIDTAMVAATDVTAANQYKVRNDLALWPKPGFYGSFFKYTVQKKVPADGNFKFFGMNFQGVPINVDSEFFADMSTITTPWSV